MPTNPKPADMKTPDEEPVSLYPFPVDDDWSLDGEQMLFMLQNNNLIEAAFATNDMSALDELVESDDFKSIFRDMGFDEAYDRYQTMLKDS